MKFEYMQSWWRSSGGENGCFKNGKKHIKWNFDYKIYISLEIMEMLWYYESNKAQQQTKTIQNIASH